MSTAIIPFFGLVDEPWPTCYGIMFGIAENANASAKEGGNMATADRTFTIRIKAQGRRGIFTIIVIGNGCYVWSAKPGGIQPLSAFKDIVGGVARELKVQPSALTFHEVRRNGSAPSMCERWNLSFGPDYVHLSDIQQVDCPPLIQEAFNASPR